MRIAFISDIHSNLEALKRVLERIDQLGAERIYCLGDIVGYGPFPDPCVQLVRERCNAVVKGNHDAGATGELAIGHFERYGRVAISWTREHLSPENATYLKQLPLLLALEEITIAHATPHDPGSWRYVRSWPQMRECFSWFATTLCFIGHTHIPIIAAEDGSMNKFAARKRHLINVGSVGQPRDGNARASFGLLDTSTWTFDIVRVEYNAEVTAEAIKSAGLPDFLGQRLFQGI